MTVPLPSSDPATAAGAPLHWAERSASEHLQAKGWRLLASNYRLRGGELDLVLESGRTVVIVEVKQRKSAAYGHPAESIDRRKLARIRATAQHYVSYVLGRPDANVRLDAVLILGTEQRHQVQHLENIG